MSNLGPADSSTTAASNTDVAGINMAEGNNPSTVNNGMREMVAWFARMFGDRSFGLSIADGGADAYTVTANQKFTAYVDGIRVRGTADSTSTTTAPTLNVNAKGAKLIVKNVAGAETALAIGDIVGNGHYEFIYDTAINSSAGGWWLIDLNAGGASFANVVEDLTPQLGGSLDTNAKSVETSKGANVASATELLLLRDGNYFHVTGTTAITSIEHTADAWKVGSFAILEFDGILTLTHHVTNLILPGAANITTAAGDIALMVKIASGDWKCVNYVVAATAPGGGGGGAGFSSIQVFTSSGTWTRPADITMVNVTCTGGGAGGSGTSSNPAAGNGGGGAGGTGKELIDVSAIASSTITIGAGGGGSTNGTGSSGGTSTWSDGTNTLTGNGGVGGTESGNISNAGLGGSGGSASGGDISIPGGDGDGGGIGISSTAGGKGGFGGGSTWGSGGAGAPSSTTAKTGGAGDAYGSGGGGGNGAAGNGGAGKAGVIYVMEYK